jgi:DNA-directed RNA polymerase I and III subunit RPAC1
MQRTGVDAPIANALRRVLLSEVPTMAIDKTIVYQNTSIVQDEVLCHRMGLLPIVADARNFQYVLETGVEKRDESTVLVFTLDITCTRRKAADGDDVAMADSAATAEEDQYENSIVTSGDLVWVPQGDQAARFTGENIPRPAYDDIVIAKLRPGQCIQVRLLTPCCFPVLFDYIVFVLLC